VLSFAGGAAIGKVNAQAGRAMHEIDLIQAVSIWVNLAYTASQWWITVTTALVVATYFAAKHIPPWLFGLVLLLYLLTAASAVFEVAWYSDLSQNYAQRLAEVRAANHDVAVDLEPGSVLGTVNSFVIYGVFVFGTLAAAAFSFVHWRHARKDEIK
jgi:hypothetical protein